MRNLKLTLFAMLCFGSLVEGVHSQGYVFDFIPTESNLYPTTNYVGSHVVLNASSGDTVDYMTALVDWSFVTPQGTLNSTNSHVAFEFGSPAGITWNSSTISFAGGAEFYIYSQASPIVIPFTDNLNVSYQTGSFSYESDSVYGYWQAVPVPEPNLWALLLACSGAWFVAHQKICPFLRKLLSTIIAISVYHRPNKSRGCVKTPGLEKASLPFDL